MRVRAKSVNRRLRLTPRSIPRHPTTSSRAGLHPGGGRHRARASQRTHLPSPPWGSPRRAPRSRQTHRRRDRQGSTRSHPPGSPGTRLPCGLDRSHREHQPEWAMNHSPSWMRWAVYSLRIHPESVLGNAPAPPAKQRSRQGSRPASFSARTRRSSTPIEAASSRMYPRSSLRPRTVSTPIASLHCRSEMWSPSRYQCSF